MSEQAQHGAELEIRRYAAFEAGQRDARHADGFGHIVLKHIELEAASFEGSPEVGDRKEWLEHGYNVAYKLRYAVYTPLRILQYTLKTSDPPFQIKELRITH